MSVCILAFSFCRPLEAQGYLDISQCFNQLLQQKLDYTSNETIRRATLAQISESTYESFKHDASIDSYFDFLPLSANYKDFDEKRRKYFFTA